MLGFAQWNAPASLLKLHQHVVHDTVTMPMLQPVRSPSLSPHLHYQMNYWLPNWMTSLLGLHFPTILLHPFLVILLVDYIIQLCILNTINFSVTLIAPVCACCFVYSHSHGLSHPLIQGKGVTIEWLLSWTESANKCMFT